jgi:diadenosine tetraphosphate (Ap4A) HIT family hydrolase
MFAVINNFILNSTIEKFRYQENLIKEYNYWVVLLRPQQITIGSLILACKEDSESLSSISSKANAEFHLVVKEIENNMKKLFSFDKINYLALMMVDKHVHFHVLPRYSVPLKFAEKKYKDSHWPIAANLSEFLDIPNEDFDELRLTISKQFNTNE